MAETGIQGISNRFFSPVPGATVSLDTTKYNNFKWSPNENETINATSPGYEGQELTVVIDTINTTSRTLTFNNPAGGNFFRTTATLATGTSQNVRFVLTFVSDGIVWSECSRTAAQA